MTTCLLRNMASIYVPTECVAFDCVGYRLLPTFQPTCAVHPRLHATTEEEIYLVEVG